MDLKGLLELLHQSMVYIRTRWKLRTAYRVSFLLDMLDIFIGVVTYFVLGNWLSGPASETIKIYGENYASFLIVGMIVNQFFRASYEVFYWALSSKYWSNELTLLLLSPRGIEAMIIEAVLVTYMDISLYAFLIFLFGFVVLGTPYSPNANPLLLILVFTLSIVSILSLSLVSASMFFILNAKQGLEPISWLVSMLTPFLAGTYYPPEILPQPLQQVAWLLPQTHGLASLRKIVLKGCGFYEILQSVAYLAAFSIVAVCLGRLLFKRALKKALKEGDMPHW